MDLTSTRPQTATAATPLGIPGYTFADLHDANRLASLYERFCEQVEADDAALWREWTHTGAIRTRRERRLRCRT